MPGRPGLSGSRGGERPVPRWLAERELPGRRLFVATPLAPETCGAVTAVVARVRSSVAEAVAADGRDPRAEREVRWVRLDGLHITLRFLGPVLDERLGDVESAVREAARGIAPFRAELDGAGAFPGMVRPRVLWVGIGEGADGLAALAARVADAFAPLGWQPEDRPFRPHLTLARADGVRAGGLTASTLVREAANLHAGWTVDRLTLFESHTGGGPARYEALAEARFGA